MPGKAHISVNITAVYVDIPASLQAVPPIENIVPLVDSEEARALAAMTERLYIAWKGEVDLDLLGHKACVVKGLYGRTAAKVWWDADTGFPQVDIIDQPRNLWLGWGQTDYRRWTGPCYSYLMTAEAIFAEYGLVRRRAQGQDGQALPVPAARPRRSGRGRRRAARCGRATKIEVYDYWYRQPKSRSRAKAPS